MGNYELMEKVVDLAKRFDATANFLFSGDFKARSCEKPLVVESVSVVWKSKDGNLTIDCGPVPDTLARLRALPENATKDEVLKSLASVVQATEPSCCSRADELEIDLSTLPNVLDIQRRIEKLENPTQFNGLEMLIYRKVCGIKDDLQKRIGKIERNVFLLAVAVVILSLWAVSAR